MNHSSPPVVHYPDTVAPAQAQYTTLAVTIISAVLSLFLAAFMMLMKSGKLASISRDFGRRVPYVRKMRPFKQREKEDEPLPPEQQLQQIITNTINMNFQKSFSEIRQAVETASNSSNNNSHNERKNSLVNITPDITPHPTP